MKLSGHVPFNPELVHWDLVIDTNHQIGGSLYFQGMPYQRGYGIGSLFAGLYRFLLPAGKEIAKAIGKEGLHTTSRILTNVIGGVPAKESVTTESKEGLRRLLQKGTDKLQGKGKKSIKGAGKRKVNVKSKKRARIVGRTVLKSKAPIFGKDYLSI